ncbi:spermidine synthase [Streptomyces sp. NPDC057702]|uniref:spermidine synthase n=1 Tax=unclassified Streptomyces TaxID=2593676 RepID=UPI003685AF23
MDDRIPVSRAVDLGAAKLLPDVDRAEGWLLTVDGAPQSYVDLADPLHLEFEYTRRLGHVLDTAGQERAGPAAPLDVLHLGGGALTLARYVAATRPGSRQTVIEADRALCGLVAEVLPPAPEAAIEVATADAREALGRAGDASVDVIVADVFGGSRVPAHLTSVEYARRAARVLRPAGRYAANLADGAPFDFLRSQVATLAAAFAHVCLIAEPAMLRGRRFGNAVLVAGHQPLPTAALARRAAADPFPARVTDGAALERLVAGAEPVWDTGAVPSPPPPSGAFSIN